MFKKFIGGQEFEISPTPPYTDQEVTDLIDGGKTVNEHYPRQIIKRLQKNGLG